MMSRNKPAMTAAERRHVDRIKSMRCRVCVAIGRPQEGQSEAHEIKQGQWFTSIPLCYLCHRGSIGWHGTKSEWKLLKLDELGALNDTIRELMEAA
jgi:rubredoxin